MTQRAIQKHIQNEYHKEVDENMIVCVLETTEGNITSRAVSTVGCMECAKHHTRVHAYRMLAGMVSKKMVEDVKRSLPNNDDGLHSVGNVVYSKTKM